MLDITEQLTAEQERDLKTVSNVKDKNEKLSWARQQKKIEDMVANMQPLEDRILALNLERQTHLDKILELRRQMIKTCIHPRNSLVHNVSHILCKFCNAKLSIPRSK